MPYITLVCVCECVVCCFGVLYLSLNVCVAGSLQQRLHHASMPLLGRPVQRCVSMLQRRGCVASEWCSQEYARMFTHTHTHSTNTLSLSLSLSRSLTTRTRTHTNTREKYVLETGNTHTITSFRMSQTRLLTNRTLVAQGLMH